MIYFPIRFIIIFTALSAIVGLLTWAGLTPSSWTVAILIVASLALAAMTAPENK